MKVFLTGATGYVGRQILRDLVAGQHDVTALVRTGSEANLPPGIEGKCKLTYGEVQRPETYRESLKGCEAVINLPGLLREFPRKGVTFKGVHFLGAKFLVDEAKGAGIQRFILMSALGVRKGAVPKYQETKFRAEEYLKSSGLSWTIFRPSIIFGNEHEGRANFFSVLNDLLHMMPLLVPILGSGTYRLQPVSIRNVSEGFVKALAKDSSLGKTYDVAGPDRYTYNDLLDMVSYVTGKYKIHFHQPMFLMKPIASALEAFKFFPVTRDQITMLEEESITDHWKEFFDDFGITPLRLVDHIHEGFRQ